MDLLRSLISVSPFILPSLFAFHVFFIFNLNFPSLVFYPLYLLFPLFLIEFVFPCNISPVLFLFIFTFDFLFPSFELNLFSSSFPSSPLLLHAIFSLVLPLSLTSFLPFLSFASRYFNLLLSLVRPCGTALVPFFLPYLIWALPYAG